MRNALDNFGGHSGGGTPLPIPNREVKPASADGTRRATSRESRSPPNYFRPEALALRALSFGDTIAVWSSMNGDGLLGRPRPPTCPRSWTPARTPEIARFIPSFPVPLHGRGCAGPGSGSRPSLGQGADVPHRRRVHRRSLRRRSRFAWAGRARSVTGSQRTPEAVASRRTR